MDAAKTQQSTGGHERSDVQVKPLAAFAVVLIVVCLIALWVSDSMFDAFAADARSADAPLHPLAPANETPPPPRLQQTPAKDLRTYEEAIDARLDSYGWIDRPQGVVHIPIERAIELTVDRKLPAREGR